MNQSTTKHLIIVLYAMAGILLTASLIPFLYQYVAAAQLYSEVIPAFGNARILTALWLSFLSACFTTVLAHLSKAFPHPSAVASLYPNRPGPAEKIQ